MSSTRTMIMSIFLLLLFSCKKDEPQTNHNCYLIPDPGPCEALIPKYYFDQTEMTCKVFMWGGCGGAVPFETLEECEAASCNR